MRIVLTQTNLDTFAESRQIISSGCLQASQGIVNSIVAMQNTFNYDPSFNVNNGTLRKNSKTRIR